MTQPSSQIGHVINLDNGKQALGVLQLDSAGSISDSLTPTAGTKSLTGTTAAALHADLACKSVIVQNDPDNAVDVLVGDSSTQAFQLRPGDALTLPVSNVNLVYAKNLLSTTQSVNWIAVN